MGFLATGGAMFSVWVPALFVEDNSRNKNGQNVSISSYFAKYPTN